MDPDTSPSKKHLHLSSPAPSDHKAPDLQLLNPAMRIRQGRSDSPASIAESDISKPKTPAAEVTLPEKYELLVKFFNSLDTSIRLLQFKEYPPLFTNISPRIETMTERRFTYTHLAQLKFIMPEAIVLDKILRHDQHTSCMAHDIQITLDPKTNSKSLLSGILKMRKIFRDRLLNFFKSHPEGDEVPEAVLPHPFNLLNENASLKSVPTSTSLTCEIPNATSLGGKLSPTILIENSKQDELVDLEDKTPKTPKETDSKGAISALKTPPVNPTSSTPKRCHLSPDADDANKSPSKLLRRPTAMRNLKFDTPEESQNSSSLDNTFDSLPEPLMELILEKVKERLAEMERKRMIASLPKRFDMVYHLFQSIGQSVVTKEELMHKLISGDLSVTDRNEVEEQLRLLLELAPDWICEKSMLSDHRLICINELWSPEVIRKRLSEAK